MSVETYKSNGEDHFDELEETTERKVVNEETIKEIEKKINNSKKQDSFPKMVDNIEDIKIPKEKKKKTQLEKELEKEVGVIKADNTHKQITKKPEETTQKPEDKIKETKKKKEEKPIPEIKPPLKFLTDPEDESIVYIGRKKSVLKQYGNTASAYIGKVAEKDCKDQKVHLDGLNPHVVFLDGARGTGKSYLLGVIAEQLAKKNEYIGQIVIDPVGVFWSMKYPNKDPKEIKILEEWDLKPEGLNNLKVFVPEGIKDQVSKDTYDDTFSMYPSLLTTEDWCITFGIDRFSPGGLLLEKTLKSVMNGYVSGGTKENPETEKIQPKGNEFDLDDIINCLQKNSEFTSSATGYKPDSIRALVSRFDAAKSWGVFSNHGTPLSKLSRENQLTVLDTSFLDETITALVIGILARRILAARKLLARQEAVKKFATKKENADQMLEIEIPPTWLYIDEAHTLIPSGNTLTPATAGIIEYVKQGRRPGCSLVFATQQPSAINTKVLSQVDVLISNKLVFNDDIHAIQKRMPAIIPKQYKEPNFIKTLPFATALCGERSEETSRAFILRIAPRASQHEGRDAETIRTIVKKTNTEVLNIVTNMILDKLKSHKEIKVNFAKDILDIVNVKYRNKVSWDEVLEKLFENNILLIKDTLYLNDEEAEKYHAKVKKKINEIENNDQEIETEDLESTDQEDNLENIDQEIEEQKEKPVKVKIHSIFSQRINRYQIEEIATSKIPKSFPLFKPKEVIQNIVLKFRTIYKIYYNIYDEEDNFKRMHCYVDSVTGEFIHFSGYDLKESKGFSIVSQLKEEDLEILFTLKKQQTLFSLARDFEISEEEMQTKFISKFQELEIIDSTIKNDRDLFILSKNFDIPFNAANKFLTSMDELPQKKEETEFLEPTLFSTTQVQENLKLLWGDLEFVSLEEVFLPIWYVSLINKQNQERIIKMEAILGREIE